MEIELTSHARRQWERLELNRKLHARLEIALDTVESDYNLGKPLIGNLDGMWSFRVGDYRILYEVKIAESVILVHEIAHRREVYR